MGKKVIAAAKAAGMPDVKMMSLIERLKNAKRGTVADFNRTYDQTRNPTWIENAIEAHELNPFHAILALDNLALEYVRGVDTLGLNDPVLNNPHSADVPRMADDIATACSLLLRSSREIDLVDPFYFGLQSGASGYREPLASILQDLTAFGNGQQVIRLHYRHSDASPSEDLVLRHAGTWLRNIIPRSLEVHLYAWEEAPGGEDFHDRFVLTDCGGLQFGAGLAIGPPTEHVLVSILDVEHAATLRSRFAVGASVYNQIGAAICVLSDGRTSKILP